MTPAEQVAAWVEALERASGCSLEIAHLTALRSLRDALPALVLGQESGPAQTCSDAREAEMGCWRAVRAEGELRRLRAGQEGYVMVPREPTEEMLEEGHSAIMWDEYMTDDGIDELLLAAYRAMLAAAQPPGKGE